MTRKALAAVALTAALLTGTAVPAQAADRGVPSPERTCKILTPWHTPVRVLTCNSVPRFVVQRRTADGWVTIYPR